MKGHHFGTVEKVKETCTKALKDIPEKAYRVTPSMPGNLARSDVSTQEKPILKK